MVNTICYDIDGKPIRRFYQWDVGQIIVLKDIPQTLTLQVELFNDDYAEAISSDLTFEESDVIATVPDSLLETGEPLRGYITWEDEGGHRRTMGYIYLPVVERVAPEDDPVEKAHEYAGESEAWAVGQIDGVDVPPDAPQYHNNAKYYAERGGGGGGGGGSAAVYVEPVANGIRITAIDDEHGTTGGTVYNGADVADGVSPSASVTRTASSAIITIENGMIKLDFDVRDKPAEIEDAFA